MTISVKLIRGLRAGIGTKWLVGAFLFGWTSIGLGAEIRGVVVDETTENPLPDVMVELGGKAEITNLAGQFRFAGLGEGIEYSLRLSHLGYEEKFVKVKPDGQVIRIALNPVTIGLREVVVTLSRGVPGETPGALSNLSAASIRRENGILEPPLLAPLIPNATAFNWGGYNLGATHLRIRGFDSNRLSISINGIPANDPEDHNVYWQDIPDFLSHTHDIQVERGVSHFRSAPSGIGGGMNLITSDAVSTRELTLGLQWGHLNTASRKLVPLADRNKIGKDRYSYRRTLTYRSGLVGDKYNFTGRFSQVKSDGYRDHSQADEWLYFLSATRYNPNMITRFQVYGGQEETGLNFSAISNAVMDTNRTYNPSAWYGRNYSGEKDHFQQPHYVLHHLWRLSPGVDLQQSLFWIHGFGYYEQLKTRRRFSEYRGDLDTNITIRSDVVRRKYVKKDQVGWMPKLYLKPEGALWEGLIGLEARQYWSDHYGRLVWTQNWSGVIGPDHQWYRWKGDKRYLELAGEVKYILNPSFKVSGGAELRNIRYKMNQERLGPFAGYDVDLDWTFVNPRLGLSYNWGETDFYLSLGRSAREPIDDQILDADNPKDKPKLSRYDMPEVKPETMTGIELGARYKTE
ncbi:MAG: carboxypeptidase-like regulatory domain-containing protein, partial [bacterium]